MESTPTGSSPLNGSSSTSTVGSWTSAAASWTRCWLPKESCSTRSPARSARPNRSSSARADLVATGSGVPRSLSQKHQLLEQTHLRVEAPLLGHVAEPAADVGTKPLPLPADFSGVGVEHTEHDAHRGRLAGAVGADEAVHLTGPYSQGEVVEGDDVAVSLRQPVQLEHDASCVDASGRRLDPERYPSATVGRIFTGPARR